MNSPAESINRVPDASPPAAANTNRSCWNCGGSECEPLFPARDFDTGAIDFPIVTCRDCGLTYTAHVTGEVLTAAYSQEYYGGGSAKFVAIIEALVAAGHRRQANRILDVYRAGNPGAAAAPAVLDIGCGRGLLLQAFAGLGARCLGIERDEFPGLDSARVEMHIGALEDAELAERRFDVIVIWHVLEHITELGSLLDELPRHLNPGGLLVVSVPNFSSWQSRFFKRHWFHLDIPRHVTHFEKSWLAKKLESMGLSIEASNTFTPSQNLYGFLQSGLNLLFPRRPNRLYKLLTRGRGGRERLALLGWGMLAGLLMPLALLETLLSEPSGQGATLTLFARKPEGKEKPAAAADPE